MNKFNHFDLFFHAVVISTSVFFRSVLYFSVILEFWNLCLNATKISRNLDIYHHDNLQWCDSIEFMYLSDQLVIPGNWDVL